MTNHHPTNSCARIDTAKHSARATWFRSGLPMLLSVMLIVGCGGGAETDAETSGGGTVTTSPVTTTTSSATTTTSSGTTTTTATTTTTTSPLPRQLAVTVGTGGAVNSTPSGIACNSGTCSNNFTSGSSVTLTATPNAGYAFNQWGPSGACSGFVATCTVNMSSNATVTASFSPVVPVSGAPYVLYTDVVSGPTSGGEGNNGAYLSIFGKNFGSSGLGTTTTVRIGGVAVARYIYLGTSKVPGTQQIAVQVGSLGGAAQGTALPIQVTVNGVTSNTNVTFTPNPGRMLYVDNVLGNDATAVPGDITKPYRYVQTTALYTGGAWAAVRAGDTIVMRGRGNANPWVDRGFENYFLRFRDKAGSAPTGANQTGAIVVMGYPGEDTFVRGLLSNGLTGGCISGINGQSFPGMAQWIVVTNLRIDCEGYDGPISQQIAGHNWRVINNDLAASTAPRTGANIPRMAGVTGNGNNAVWYGNHIHDIQGSSGECHGFYIDGDGSYDIAYNYVHDIRDGNGINIYVNGGNGSTVTDDINLHHNVFHNVSKHGVNIADGARNNIKVWNNVAYNVAFAAIRFNTTQLSGAKIMNNTFYNTNTNGNTAYGALTNDWNLPAGSLDMQNNIFHVATGTRYNSGSVGISASHGTFAKNIWYNGTGSPSFDSTAITLNPLFVAAGSNFHLQATSPAIGVGSIAAGVTSLVTTDLEINARSSSTMDIGALKY